jgi:GWxTD domain-containing protein
MVYTGLLLFFLILLNACSSSRKISEQNLAYSFKRENFIVMPDFEVYHHQADSSTIYFKVNTRDLLYTKAPEATSYSAWIEMNYRVLADYNSKQVIDSGSFIARDGDYKSESFELHGKFQFRMPAGQQAVMEVKFADANRGISYKHYVSIDKSISKSRQYFLLKREQQQVPLFRNYLTNGERAVLQLPKGDEKVYVKYYRRDFPLPPPPFSTNSSKGFSYQADSIFSLTAFNGQVELYLPTKGFYHFQTDTTQRAGFTVYRHHDNFPFLTEPEQLIPMLRFITTRQEYEDMAYAVDKKKALDEFWIRTSGNADRARQIIKSYYGRAEDANRIFSSYVEGWRSDRGLVYIIFGQPNAVYRDLNSETWVYGDERSSRSLNFNFVRVINPFSDNDFMLNRSELYKDEWYKSVDTWRQGRVFNDKP